MIRKTMVCAALLVAIPAAAQEAAPPAGSSAVAAGQEPEAGLLGSGTDPEKFDLARKKVFDCEGEKFQFTWGSGSRPTKVTLCSKKDATPAELVIMLDDAATKLEATDSIAEDRRVAIVQQIRAKIAEIQSASANAAESSPVAQTPADVPQGPASVPAMVAAPSPYPAVPVLTPAPVPVAARPTVLSKPRLTIECYTPGDIGSGGPCTVIRRETRVIVKAGEALGGGTGLRFRRYGETRAEVVLSPMRTGQSVRFVVPRKLCIGVVGAEIEIQVIQGGNAVDTRGPFTLRC